MISPNYQRIISQAEGGKGGTTLLYHPNLLLENSWTLNSSRASWAQFKLDNTTISVAIIYALSGSARARALL